MLHFALAVMYSLIAAVVGDSPARLVQVLHKDLAEDTTAHLARVGALFDKPQFSDVRVVAADGCGFHCHRAILAACSKPFERAMLTEGTHAILPSRRPRYAIPCELSMLAPADMQHIQSALEVRLKDTSSATLQAVLQFCYTAECHLTPDNVLPVCALAEHFEVKALHSACVQFIEHNISVSSCCTMLEMAAQYNMEALRKASATSILLDSSAPTPEKMSAMHSDSPTCSSPTDSVHPCMTPPSLIQAAHSYCCCTDAF